MLLSWLEDLPTHDHHHAVSVSQGYPITQGGQQAGSTATLTRSPQRQRMLTNGSFVKVR